LTDEDVVQVVGNAPEKEEGGHQNERHKLPDWKKMVPRLGTTGFFGARDLHSGVLLGVSEMESSGTKPLIFFFCSDSSRCD